MRTLRAFTIVEVIVVIVLIAVALGALFTFLGTTRRMNDASRGSAAVASALLIQETLAMDVRQLGVDPKRTQLFDMTAAGISFYRTVFEKKEIRLRPVRWMLKGTKGGNAQLVRTELTPKGRVNQTLDGFVTKVNFGITRDTSSAMSYLRVDMTVLPEDMEPGPAADKAGVPQVLLARIPVPVHVVNTELEASCRLLPEAALLPLETFN